MTFVNRITLSTHGLAWEPVPTPKDLHEWISFSDPVNDQTWQIDATFLRSNWTCIYGNGCKGVLEESAKDLMQGCCSHGAHFIDERDLDQVKNAVERLEPEHWSNYKRGRNQRWLTKDKDGSDVTRRVDGACIFHNEIGFDGGFGCAFHVAAVAAGERPMDWKPDVCWQVPLRLEEFTEDDGHVVSQLREWKRRDWGDGGIDFHWWCTDHPDAFIGKKPVYQHLKDEIVELVGERTYKTLVALLEAKRSTPLPHPQMRRT